MCPDEGETVRFENLELRTERVQGNRIVSVLITRVAPIHDGTSEPVDAGDHDVADASSA